MLEGEAAEDAVTHDEGEEAGALNGHSEASRGSDDWREKFEGLNLEHEKM